MRKALMTKILFVFVAMLLATVLAVGVFAEGATYLCGGVWLLEDGKTEVSGTATIINLTEIYDFSFDVLELVNEARTNAGAPELIMDSDLVEAAMQRATEASVSVSHTRPSGVSDLRVLCSKINGENLAGYQLNPTQVMYGLNEDDVNCWMNSYGHKMNILDPDYKSIGVACVNIDGYYYWAQEFSMKLDTDKAVEIKDYPKNVDVQRTVVTNDGKMYKCSSCLDTFGCKTAMGECPSCGATSGIEIVDAIGHNFSTEYTIDVYPTSTTPGLKSRHCTECSAVTDVVEIKPLVSSFKDVETTSYYYEAILWAGFIGVTSGTSSTTFSPDKECLRGEIVTFLWRAAGKPEPKSTNNPFTDVKTTDYFYKAVLWAVENEITSGTSATTFSPGAACTRGQTVTFMWRAAGKPEPESTNNPFVDVKTTDFFYKAVLWAVEKGITKGLDSTHFGPSVKCTRGQIVTFLYRGKDEIA